jgi:hypothetical protein
MQAQVRHSPLAEQPKTYTTIASSEFVAEAAESCRQRGLNLTPIRRRVLEVVAASTVPVPAYAIVYQLSDTKLVAPPTIYRALEFLIEAGFVRHLALRRAYICCTQPVGGPLGAVCRLPWRQPELKALFFSNIPVATLAGRGCCNSATLIHLVSECAQPPLQRVAEAAPLSHYNIQL